MKLKWALACFAVMLGIESNSQTTEIPNFGNGILNLSQDRSSTMRFALRTQAGRLTDIQLDEISGVGRQQQYTRGISRFIAGHNLNVQTDSNYLELSNNNNELLFRLQFEI